MVLAQSVWSRYAVEVSKKKKNSKKLQIEVVHVQGQRTMEGAFDEDNDDTNVMSNGRHDRAFESFVPAEPGWNAVYHACPDHGIDEDKMLPIEFWVINKWESNNYSDVCGLVLGPGGRFYEAPADHHFVGYARPGESADDALARHRR